MKHFAIFFALISLCLAGHAQQNELYRNLPANIQPPTLPQIPDNKVSLKDFGAQGDGITLCTDAFNEAINALTQKGGGHLLVPDGIWLTAPVTLQSNIDINISRNAIILMTPDKTLHENHTGKSGKRIAPAFNAYKAHDISITGEGVIDGQGAYWRPVKRGKVSDEEWKQFKALGGTESEKGDIWYPYDLKNVKNMAPNPVKEADTRADLVRFENCERILLQGVTFQNSPRFHVHPCFCKDISVIGVTIRCPWNAQNGDALDLSNCQRCLITESTIDAGDDGICMKGGTGESGVKAGPCKDILIENNTVLHAHGGFVIGSDVSGGMENIIVRNNRFMGTDTGLRFKSSYGRGGMTKNIFISNIVMSDIKNEAIVFETTYANNQIGVQGNDKAVTDFAPDFQDIHIDNVVCHGCKTAISAHGEEGMVHDIAITNSTFFYNSKDKDIDDACKLSLDNVNFKTW